MPPVRVYVALTVLVLSPRSTVMAPAALTDGAICPYAPTRGAQQGDQPWTTSAHVRRYSGLRRSNIVARIEQALRECGADILVRPSPATAPFEFAVKTPTGDQRELVCYAFPAEKSRRAGGPPDRHRFQIGYGTRSDRCHQLFFDPRGMKTTLLFGMHLEMGLFIGVDPRMHSPTWFPRSVEFRTSDLEAARAHRWHGWERERSDARHKVRPEESLLTETVIAFRPDQFLRYVEFERLASGLDCGERCLLSDRIEKSLSQGGPLRSARGRHSLEIQLGLPASDILDMVMERIGRE
jgi:uncharacterized protein YceK